MGLRLFDLLTTHFVLQTPVYPLSPTGGPQALCYTASLGTDQMAPRREQNQTFSNQIHLRSLSNGLVALPLLQMPNLRHFNK